MGHDNDTHDRTPEKENQTTKPKKQKREGIMRKSRVVAKFLFLLQPGKFLKVLFHFFYIM